MVPMATWRQDASRASVAPTMLLGGTPSSAGRVAQLPVIPALLLGLILKLFCPVWEPPDFLTVAPFLLLKCLCCV